LRIAREEKIFTAELLFNHRYYKLKRKSMRFCPHFMRVSLLVHFRDFFPLENFYRMKKTFFGWLTKIVERLEYSLAFVFLP
jgi:hypothetical protein